MSLRKRGCGQALHAAGGPSSAAKTQRDRTVLQRQIDATDRQIDQLVYELYGLTEVEIQIVEAANA